MMGEVGGVRARPGFEMRMGEDSRIWNTFDAHRLLHWAGETVGLEAQAALKRALFEAHFTRGEDMGDAGALAGAAEAAGLDRGEAAAVLAEGRCGSRAGSPACRRWW